MFRVDFVTLFPEMVRPALDHSILGRAAAAGRVAFRTANPRDFCHDRHLKVDERPFGGEPGMLIRAEPVARAVEWLARRIVDRTLIRRFTTDHHDSPPTTHDPR